MTWLNPSTFPNGYGWVEIVCLAAVIYYLLYFLRGTRGTPILTGFVLLYIAMIGITRIFHLDALNWILGRVSVYLAVALLVIFQPEIRRALAEIGKQHFFGSTAASQTLVDSLVEAVGLLAKRRIGALIAVEQAIGTRPFQETGIRLDCALSPELLASLFFPYTPLHDGGVIISGNRIATARCMFPLSQHNEANRLIGTRHRAAMGLSEETDAVVIVVSEETGVISIAREGQLMQHLSEDQLRRFLTDILIKPSARKPFWQGLRGHWAQARTTVAGHPPGARAQGQDNP